MEEKFIYLIDDRPSLSFVLIQADLFRVLTHSHTFSTVTQLSFDVYIYYDSHAFPTLVSSNKNF